MPYRCDMSADELQHHSMVADAAVAEARALSASWTDDDVYIVLQPGPHTSEDWSRQLPAEGTILNRVMATDGRQWWFVLLDNPLLHRIPDGVDPDRRYPAEYLTRHEGSDFFWAYALLIATADPADPLLLGANGHRVDVAVVVDVSAREDPELDPAKVDIAGQAFAEVGLSTTVSPDSGDSASSIAPEAPKRYAEEEPRLVEPPDTPPVHTSAPRSAAAAPATTDGDWVNSEIERFGQLLRPLVGEVALSEIPRPQPLAKGQIPSRAYPQYVVDGNQFAYYTLHPKGGHAWRTTTDSQELLYWCVDDIARGLAWRWAQRTPSYQTMSPAAAQRALWAPYWQLLMTAINPRWGAETGRTVRALL